MYKVKVYVTLKEGVIDPAGAAAAKELRNSEYPEVKDVRVGKYIELFIGETDKNLSQTIDEMCKELLVNTEVEDYRYEVEEADAE